MSGSPVYVDGRLLGALSYRIGQFSKDPIAGITPIEQMLEVRDIPLQGKFKTSISPSSDGFTFSAMETPLLMSGFAPEVIKVWKEQMAGTGLDIVSAGGAESGISPAANLSTYNDISTSENVVPGSAVSMQLIRGEMEMAATCTVTYVDPKQLLACGHPVLQAGEVSMPMTTAEVVATLASPLNAFKIINTGRTIGAFTQDRDAAIRGELGAQAHMIPVTITVAAGNQTKEHRVEVIDLPAMTPSAVLVSVYQILLQNNLSSSTSSYHITGAIRVRGMSPIPLDSWATPSDIMTPQVAAAFSVADSFTRLYGNAGRSQPVESVSLRIDSIATDVRAELESVRLVSSNIVHAGDPVEVEATVRPWQRKARNLRLKFTLPTDLDPGALRLLVSSAATLDHSLEAAQPQTKTASFDAASERLRGLHPADRVYVSLLLPEAMASVGGSSLDSLPLSIANTLEPQRNGGDVTVHGESIELVADAPADGVLSGQQILSLRVEPGGGLH